VNKQVDLGDGILGMDFLTKMNVQICYERKSVKFKWNNVSLEKTLVTTGQTENSNRKVGTITLPKRSEKIVKIPVECEDKQKRRSD
jgi:hypothetical protein